MVQMQSSRKATVTQTELSKRVSRVLGMLTAQFVFGAILVALGDPEKISSSLLKWISHIDLALHILTAIGLVVTGVMLYRAIRSSGDAYSRKYATRALWSVIVAFIGGVLILAPFPGALASLIMAGGFIGAYVSYGRILVGTRSV